MAGRKEQMLFEKQAEILKALAHPLRIAIVVFLKDKNHCVCDIAEHIGSERSNVSRHLSVMVKAGILEYHKEGLKVIYKLKTPCVLQFFSCMKSVLKQQAKDNQILLKAL